MRRLKLTFALTIATLMAALGLGATPAHAYPTTRFLVGNDVGGATSGGITWYNRSVGLQGEVCDASGAGATVWFDFSQGSVYLSTQSRTVTNDCRPFNFTEDAPRGGITDILITICSNSLGCAIAEYHRP